VQKCLEYALDLVLLNFNTNDYDVPDFMRLPSDLATLRKLYMVDLAHSVYQGVMGVAGRQPPRFDFRNRTTALLASHSLLTKRPTMITERAKILLHLEGDDATKDESVRLGRTPGLIHAS
jgi:hypothetical protein